MDAIPPEQHQDAAEIYGEILTDPAWILMKTAEYVNGDWEHRERELFHHFLKLQILGADRETIKQLIGDAQEKGLPIPDSLNADHWEQYSTWFGPPISWKDIQKDAGPGIIRDNENYSLVFTASGQPGARYRDFGGGAGSTW